jgi:2-oxoglutarate dehydrogenase E2 component (dihydrolipoamide succinyltransferase)
MPHDIKIPSLGESIVSGILTTWNFKSGDYVESGTTLYELETDKVTSDGIADVSGILEILVPEDTEVEIGQIVGTITETESAPEPESEAAVVPEPVATDASSSAKHPPSVERLSAISGINPDSLVGTGKDNRVTKEDMLRAEGAFEDEAPSVSEPAPVPISTPEPSPVEVEASEPATDTVEEPTTPPVSLTPVSEEKTSRKKMSPIRKKIAERLVSVKNEAAILTTFNEVDMSAIMKLRKELQDDFVETHGVKLGFMSFFVKATVQALKAVPQINAQIDGQEIVTNHYYDIGVAVGSERGLVVPVLRDCDRLSLAEIEAQLIDYAKQANSGKLDVESMQGGVFTISNGGVYGSLLSTPIINPPQSGILGMHTIQQRPVAVDGEVVIRPMMYLALSYDHRIVDGKEAVTFLIKIKKALENPSRLFLGI